MPPTTLATRKTAGVLDQFNGVLRDLLGQFTGGAQDQCAGCGRLEVARVGGVFAFGALGRRLAGGGSLGASFFKFSAFSGFLLGHLLDQGVQHRQQEGRGFAAAGLAGHHQVGVAIGLAVFRTTGSGQRQRNGAQLHGCRLGVAQIGNSLDQFRGQAQLDKAIGQF